MSFYYAHTITLELALRQIQHQVSTPRAVTVLGRHSNVTAKAPPVSAWNGDTRRPHPIADSPLCDGVRTRLAATVASSSVCWPAMLMTGTSQGIARTCAADGYCCLSMA